MISSKNPYNGDLLQSFKELSKSEIENALKKADFAFDEWKKTDFPARAALMRNAAVELRQNSRDYAKTITEEMGKPIVQSLAEIEKCAWVCDFYAEHAEAQLAPESIETNADNSYVSYEPLGPVLAIMPWNYPFWQVFRFAAPGLMAGNTGVLKHASNVMRSANNIQKVFERAGFPEGCFQNLIIGKERVEEVLRDKRIKAVSLTGSEAAGSAVAAVAGKEIKKSVLELGGSNALVVFEDAKLEETVNVCIQARFQNTGQSCIAGKRLLLHENIAKPFLEKFKQKVEALKDGDPMNKNTFIGVLARQDLAESLEKQVEKSLELGAKILLGGNRKNAYFEPTILTEVTPEMPVFKEETFGPVIGVTIFKTQEEAIDLVNFSKFGLGASIFTEDMEKAKNMIPKFEDGAVYVNGLVKSDPRLPFGGTKKSGYGRELSYHGIREFVNIKTVYFNKF